jgi:hypothetical protein
MVLGNPRSFERYSSIEMNTLCSVLLCSVIKKKGGIALG